MDASSHDDAALPSNAEGVLFDLGPVKEAEVAPPGGPPRLRRAQRDQIVMRNLALDALLPEDHRARIVWQYVEGLDLSPLYASIRSVEGDKGRAATDPRPIRGFCWLCGCMPRWKEWAVPVDWPVCVKSTSPTSGWQERCR